jgi:hypothetical protein
MLAFFRGLLQPAPTFPLDPYRWRHDNRTTGEKVVSGMRLGVGLVAGFLVIVLAFGGISTLPAGAPAYGNYGPFVSWGMVCLSTVILFLTANRWASIGIGFFCVPAVFKSLAVLVVGTNPSSSIPYYRLTRTQAGEILFICIFIIALTWRFAGNRPAPTTFIDRIALTFFVLATIKQMVIPYSWPPLPLISGLSALLIAWCVYRWQQAGRIRKHHHGSSSTFDTLPES